MYIQLQSTLRSIEKCLPHGDAGADTSQLKKAYTQTLRLQSQLLSLIYDLEDFGCPAGRERFAGQQSGGRNAGGSVVLAIHEPLPYFEKAFVEIGIITPRGSDNTRVWDTSNRAIQLILNNLKGVFFHDDDMAHMAFSVVGKWGEKGVTVIRITNHSKSEPSDYGQKTGETMDF